MSELRCHHLSPIGGLLTLATRWRLTPPPPADAVERLAASLAVPSPLAALLVQRSMLDSAAARAFLRPDLESLADPYSLAGMSDAVNCIVNAVRNRTTILVHGDYDVDGQCSAALLTRALREAGATVHAFVPHRLHDGYDFGPAGLREAERVGAGLVLTCDCGITAVETVDRARSMGLKVVVTDHHLPGAQLPDADAILDPQRPDDTSGLGHMCGTGLAFKLVQALVAPLGLPAAFPMHLLDYVAVATIADVVPLVGENRVLVKHGLRLLAATRWPGLAALRQSARLDSEELRAGQIGFTLAPRLNAAGRVADAKLGLQILLTDDPEEAKQLADELELLNIERQALDQRILDEALEMVATEYADAEVYPAIVLASAGWHAGVIGIVASRIVERYGRPAFLISLEGEQGKGSGRSIEGFDLHEALVQCDALLLRYGGHRMAAGLTIEATQVDAFREAFVAAARRHLSPADIGPTQRVDLEVALSDITDELERLGRHLEPCGMGNAAPVYGIRAVQLEGTRIVGTAHLKTTLAVNGQRLDAIAFGWADRVPWLSTGTADVAFRLERNVYRGHSSLQARILALAPAGAA